MKNYAHFRRTLLRAAKPLLLAGGLLCLSSAAQAGTPATSEAAKAAANEYLAVQAANRGDALTTYSYAVDASNAASRCYYNYAANPSSVSDLAAVYSAFAASSGAIACSAAANGDYGTARAYANAAAGYEQSARTVVDYAYAVYAYNNPIPSYADGTLNAYMSVVQSYISTDESSSSASFSASHFYPVYPFLAERAAYYASIANAY